MLALFDERSLVQNHLYASVNTCVISQSSQLEIGLSGCVECKRLIIRLDLIDDALSGFGHAAADDERLRIHYTRDGSEAFSEDLRPFIHDPDGNRIVVLKLIPDILGAGRCRKSGRFIRMSRNIYPAGAPPTPITLCAR